MTDSSGSGSAEASIAAMHEVFWACWRKVCKAARLDPSIRKTGWISGVT